MEAGEEWRACLLEMDARASEAAVAGTSEGDADASADVAHDSGERLLPFVGEFAADCFEEVSCFTSKEPIGGCYKGCKVAALLEAGLEVMFLLSRFFAAEHCLGVLGVVGLRIEVNNGDIDEAVSGCTVEVTEEEISSVLFASVGVKGRACGRCSGRCSGRGGKDHGLGGDAVVGSGLGVQGAYFSSEFIVAGVNEAA